MKIIYYISCLSIFLLSSCKKEHQSLLSDKEDCRVFKEMHSNEELYCSEYLISTPGSWWKYSSGLILEANNLKGIQTYSLAKKHLGCSYYNEDQLLAQKNPWLGPIDSISQIETNMGNLNTYKHPVLDTTLGDFYVFSYTPSYQPRRLNTYSRKVIAKYDSLEIQGNMYYDLIKVQHYFERDFQKGPTYVEVKKYTFARNIGIVRYEFPFQGIDEQLTEYYIAE